MNLFKNGILIRSKAFHWQMRILPDLALSGVIYTNNRIIG